MLVGDVYGRLTCIELLPKRRARFRCTCGTVVDVRRDNARSLHTSSCGCLRNETMADLATTHGLRGHELYSTWMNIIQRCTNPNNPRYDDWGGRGIRICDEWRHDFPAFVLYVGPRPTGHSLDRINNDGHYEPGNVRWATASLQRQNQYRAPWPFGVLAEEKDGWAEENIPELRNPPGDGGPLETT